MSIQDIWLNHVLSSAFQFAGYGPLTTSTFPHQIYSFLIGSIRDADEETGLILKRWLDGAQVEFETWYSKIGSLPNITSPALAPAEALPYLRWIVGLTDTVVGKLGAVSESELRSLIAAAVPIWKQKGSASGIELAVRSITAKLPSIVNYFRFRTLSDEMEIGMEQLNVDPWLVDDPAMNPSTSPVSVVDGVTYLKLNVDSLLGTTPVPTRLVRIRHRSYPLAGEERQSYISGGSNWVDTTGLLGQPGPTGSLVASDYVVSVDPDPYVFDVRVYDDGSVNRDLLEGMLAELRPTNERIFVRYLDFLDDFRGVPLWVADLGSYTQDKAAGTLTLDTSGGDAAIHADDAGAATWARIRALVQAQLEVATGWFEIRFCVQNTSNFYAVRINPATKLLSIDKVVSTVRTTLDSMTWVEFHLSTYYSLMAQQIGVGVGQELVALTDGAERLRVTDSTFTTGGLAVAAQSGQVATITFAELFQDPLTSVRLGP